MAKPNLASIPEFYRGYVGRVKDENILTALESNKGEAVQYLEKIPVDKWDYRYAEGKWNIKEMVQHIIDTERIFSYRALCFARGEKASLPGFNENDYAAAAEASTRKTTDLLEEFSIVRAGTICLFRSFSDKQLEKTGIANNHPIEVNTIGFIAVGHVLHHLNILSERYLS